MKACKPVYRNHFYMLAYARLYLAHALRHTVRRSGMRHISLRQYDDGQYATAAYQRQVALQPLQIEVQVQAHDQQSGIYIADHGMAAAIGIAPHDLVQRWNADRDPALLVLVLCAQDPVTDG